MKLELIKFAQGTKYDITKACARIAWSGSASAPCRQVSFDYVNAPYDKTIKIPDVTSGDFVSLVDDKEGEIFFGQIFDIEKSSQLGTITYQAQDAMIHLLKSKASYNFKNITPEAIAQQVCADAQVPVRFLYPTGFNIASMLCDKMSLHDVIMAAYTKAYKATGMKFFPMVYKRGFSVYSAVWSVNGFVLSDRANIYASDLSESSSKLVNRVKIYDEKGTQIGEVQDENSVKAFGVFQEAYSQEKGVDATTAANKLLSVAPQQTVNLSAVGDINCLSCYFVQVKDGATGLTGKYWISSDTHTWQNGVYKMDLELKFDSIMKETESTKEKETKK